MRRQPKFSPGDHVEVTQDDADSFGGTIGDHGIVDHVGAGNECFIRFIDYTSRNGLNWTREAQDGALYVMPENLRYYQAPVYVIREEPNAY